MCEFKKGKCDNCVASAIVRKSKITQEDFLWCELKNNLNDDVAKVFPTMNVQETKLACAIVA